MKRDKMTAATDREALVMGAILLIGLIVLGLIEVVPS